MLPVSLHLHLVQKAEVSPEKYTQRTEGGWQRCLTQASDVSDGGRRSGKFSDNRQIRGLSADGLQRAGWQSSDLVGLFVNLLQSVPYLQCLLVALPFPRSQSTLPRQISSWEQKSGKGTSTLSPGECWFSPDSLLTCWFSPRECWLVDLSFPSVHCSCHGVWVGHSIHQGVQREGWKRDLCATLIAPTHEFYWVRLTQGQEWGWAPYPCTENVHSFVTLLTFMAQGWLKVPYNME